MKNLDKIRTAILWILVFSLLGVGISVFNFIRTAGEFNLRERILEGVGNNKEATLGFTPRGGSSDSWMKAIDESQWTGAIYEAYVENISGYDMPEWTLRMNFHSTVYLNSCWCGTVELHQFRDGAELIQTVDPRNYDAAALKCDYRLVEGDLMLILNDGDYLIYHPSETDWETPLRASGSVSPGLIFYYEGDVPDFSDIAVNYRLHRETLEGRALTNLKIVAVLWGMLLVVYGTMTVMDAASRKRLAQQQLIIEEFLTVFSNFVDAKDAYTQGHSHRVAEYSQKIAKAMGKDEDECRSVYYIGMMHDCGKVYIPDDILKKPGRLTDEEFAVIKSHTIHGGEMLKDVKSVPNLLEGALHHHERYDGRGYPDGLVGKEIPEVGRIICVADSFDAMNSSRCYRPNLTPEVILGELTKNRGTQFDPDIVDIFLTLIDKGEVKWKED